MSCVPSPTETQFSTGVSTVVSTSFSESVTTLPGTTSTNVITSCLASASAPVSDSSIGGIGTCISSTVITSTTVIDGGVSTTQVPFATTNVLTTSVPTNTLFAPCSSSTSPTTPPTTSHQSSTQFSQSATTIVSTPTTTFTSSQETTLDNGQTTQIFVTVTSALPPSSSVSSTPIPIATTQAGGNNGNGNSVALGAIIGGSVGGFFGLLAIIAAVWFCRRRRTNFDDIFEKDYEEYTGIKPLTPGRGRMLDLEDEPVNPVEANTQPKPYVYGLVGSNKGNSPPSLNAGLSPAAAESRHSLTTHTRSSSTTPLMNNAPASRPTSIAGASQNGVRSGSPGPLGVHIPTGPAFSASLPADGESPTSIAPPRGPLFVANMSDTASRAGSPAPGSPSPAAVPIASLSNVAGPSLGSPGATASPSGFGAPPAALAYIAEKNRLHRDNTVSSASVYSQPSREPTPPPSKALAAGSGQTSGSVVVHQDGGRVQPPDQPPAYQD